MASPDSDVNSLSSSTSSSSAASPANNDVLNGYLKLPNHFVDEGYSNYDDDGSSQESNTKQSETSNSDDSNSSGNDATNAVTSNDNNYATIPPSTTTELSYSYYQQPDRQMYSDLVYANLTNSAPQFQQQQQQQPQQMIQPHMSMDFLRFYYPQYYPHAAPPPPPPPHHLPPLPPQSLPGSVYSYGMDPMMMRPMENTWVNKETSGEMNNKEEEEGETTANEEENDENDSVSTTSSSNTGASNHLRNIQPRPPAQQQKPTPQPPQQQQQHQTGINVPDAEMLAAAVNSKAKARSNAGVGGSRNTKRQRTKFDQHQIELLEAAFNLTHYPDTNQVDRMSTALGLSIERISIWFQNRRAKFKKSAKSGGATQQQQPPKVSADKAPLSIRTNLEIQKTPSYNQTCQATTSSSGMMNQSVTNSCSSLSVTSSPVSNDSSSNSPPPKQSDPQSTSKHHHHQENEEESSDDSSQEDVAAAAAETRTSGERDAFNMASSLYGNAANLYRPHETYVYPQPQTQSTPSLFQPYMMDKEEPLSPQRHSLHLPMHNPNHLFVYHPQQFVPPPPQQPHFYPQYFPANTASTNLNQ